jgi:hypothetical protein
VTPALVFLLRVDVVDRENSHTPEMTKAVIWDLPRQGMEHASDREVHRIIPTTKGFLESWNIHCLIRERTAFLKVGATAEVCRRACSGQLVVKPCPDRAQHSRIPFGSGAVVHACPPCHVTGKHEY